LKASIQHPFSQWAHVLARNLCERSRARCVRQLVFRIDGEGRRPPGFAAAAEYYFGKPLSSYTPEDAGKAALLAGITKSPVDYAPVPGDPRPLRRRNQILALMARNGYIPEGLAQRCQAEPVRVAAHGPVKTHAPAAIESVFAELKQQGGGRFGVEDLVQGRISVRSTVGRAGADRGERSPGTASVSTRSVTPGRRG
jgi:membrane carboxypeptidase/penicillin-binding protein